MDPRKVERIQELMERLERLRDAAVPVESAVPEAIETERRAILDELRQVAGPAFTLYHNGRILDAVSLAG